MVMKEYKVIYESINGQNKTVYIKSESEEKAEEKVLCNYPDCLQVICIR